MQSILARPKRSLPQRIRLFWQKYFAVLRVSIASNLAYIMEVLFRTLFLIVLIFVFVQLWTTTFAARNTHSLGGFTIRDMIWYLATTEAMALSLPMLTRQIDQEVRSGQLAYLLGRPCSYVLYHFAQYLGERCVRFCLNAVVAGILALIFVGPPPFTWMSVVAFPLVLLLAVCIEYVLYFSIGLLAFWTEETTPFYLIMSRMALVLGGVLVPLEILPQPLRSIAQILPFSAILYGPARTLVHFELVPFAWVVVQQLVTLAVGSLIMAGIYRLATRRVNINGG